MCKHVGKKNWKEKRLDTDNTDCSENKKNKGWNQIWVSVFTKFIWNTKKFWYYMGNKKRKIFRGNWKFNKILIFKILISITEY